MAADRSVDEAEGLVEEALAAGAWDEALETLRARDRQRALSSAELQQLAHAAYGAGDLEGAIAAWEQLHARGVATGDHLGAGAAAATIAMYLMMDTGLMAPVRGWASRAERLLEGQGETSAHAQVAMVRAYERFLSGDLDGAAVWARRAVAVGTRQRAPAAVAMGRVARARLEILDGRVDEGLALLDDVAVSTVSGELDSLTVGMVYCELICAMQGLAQYDRAEEWTDAMERWRQGAAFGGINGRCRVHHAEILRLRGRCEEAEAEALHACEELRPWMRREFGWPLTELGTIRLRRGDLAGAEAALLAAHRNGWDPHPALALVRLAQGRVGEAEQLIAGAIDHPRDVPSKERPPQTGLRRAPLLEAHVEIAITAGNLETASRAAEELSGIAEVFRSRALAASAALARGRVALAAGEPLEAVAECEAAVAAWCDVAAPYEAAVARTVLAAALRASGSETSADLEWEAAQAELERIGARAPTAPTEFSASPTSPSDPRDGRKLQSVFRREGDTRSIVYNGTAVRVRELKGMRHLARLLAEPGREFHVLDLVAAEDGVGPAPGPGVGEELVVARDAGAGPALDEKATVAYRRRLQEIDEDIEEARRFGDADRAALAEADRDYLVAELSRAYGLGGRSRRMGTASERARASITRAVRYALARIAAHHPELGEHLEVTVRTGTYCSYVPDPRALTDWEL